MNILPTPIPDLRIAEAIPHDDQRGLFARFYCERELSEIIGLRRIVQINYSRTLVVGAIRGLHFQRPPSAEMKLVRCVKGRVWDVAVDLREGSRTFLQWFAEEITPANARMMIIPEGFAHGFQVLEPESELLYLHTAFYNPKAEGGLRYDDPQIAIAWPLTVTDLSSRDANHSLIASNFHGIAL